MLLTVTLIIFIAAILLMFSSDVTNIFKKLAAMPGVKWILPIAIVSYYFTYDEPTTLWILRILQAYLQSAVQTTATHLPFQTGAIFTAKLIVIMGLSFLPVFLLNIWHIKRHYFPLNHKYFINGILWLIIVILLTATDIT